MSRNSKENHTTAGGSFRFGEFDFFPSERRLLRGQDDVALPPNLTNVIVSLRKLLGREAIQTGNSAVDLFNVSAGEGTSRARLRR
jgi:hypothetical protein